MNDEINLELGKENNLYEREQLAAKLQNLKTQFRNRKIAVDEGLYYSSYSQEKGSFWNRNSFRI